MNAFRQLLMSSGASAPLGTWIMSASPIVAEAMGHAGFHWGVLDMEHTPLDMMARIGVVILVGVVVNNAIVLVDMANRLRAEGMPRFEALMQAGRNRFRPILMTTCTTVFGLIPMAVGNAKVIGMAYAPLGRTMIGGLIAATVLTLVIVPLFYTLLDDLREHVARVFGSALSPHVNDPVAKGGVASGVGRANRVE